jgi:hypothetical protein
MTIDESTAALQMQGGGFLCAMPASGQVSSRHWRE